MGRIVSYQTCNPSSFFENDIFKFYKMEYKHDKPNNYSQAIMPDGCSGIFYTRGGNLIQVKDDSSLTEIASYNGILAYSQLTKKLRFRFTDDCTVYGILFKPLGLSDFFTCDIPAMCDTLVDASYAIPLAKHLFEKVASESEPISLSAFVHHCENILARICLERELAFNIPPWLRRTITLLHNQGWKTPINKYYELCPVSARRLQGVFHEKVGCSIKTYLRIIRFHNFLKKCKTIKNKITINEIAQEFGYYDESHLCHEVKQIINATPHDLLEQYKIIYYG